MHNYHTQFLPKPYIDAAQRKVFDKTMEKHPGWRPLSVLTVVLDSSSRSQVLRDCGLPKTVQLLEKMYFSGNIAVMYILYCECYGYSLM